MYVCMYTILLNKWITYSTDFISGSWPKFLHLREKCHSRPNNGEDLSSVFPCLIDTKRYGYRDIGGR